jgi:hypothetical protein
LEKINTKNVRIVTMKGGSIGTKEGGVSAYPRPEWGENYDSGDCGGLAYVKIPLIK